jgi:toxin-antitoxin system PIN domain toxin
VIAPDANLLIYANHFTSPSHEASKAWLEELFSGTDLVGLPIFSVTGFLRFMTHPGIHPRPASFRQASEIVESWLAVPNVRIIYPGERHWQIVKQLGLDIRASGNVITDVAIAALAMEYGAVVHTNDRDFARFPGLRWFNPLER